MFTTILKIHFPFEEQDFLIGGDANSVPLMDESLDGVAWSQPQSIPSGTTGVYSIAFADDTWIAVVGSDIYRSTDHAKSWAKVATLAAASNPVVAGKKFPGNNKATFVVISTFGFSLISNDGGITWGSLTGPATDGDTSVQSCVAAGDYIFILCQKLIGSNGEGKLVATKDGVTWSTSLVFTDIPTSTTRNVIIRGVAFNESTRTYSTFADSLITISQVGPVSGAPGDTPLQKLATASSGNGLSWGSSVTYGDGGIDFGFGAVPNVDTIYQSARRTQLFTAYQPGGPLMTAGGGIFALTAMKWVGSTDGAPATETYLVGISSDGSNYTFNTIHTDTLNPGDLEGSRSELTCIAYSKSLGLFVLGSMISANGAITAFYDAATAVPTLFTSSDGTQWTEQSTNFIAPGVLGLWCIGVGNLKP